jgi:hypothetical protein
LREYRYIGINTVLFEFGVAHIITSKERIKRSRAGDANQTPSMIWSWMSILCFSLVLYDATTSAFAPPRGIVRTTTKLSVGGSATTTASSLNAILHDAATKVESVRNLAVAGRIPWTKLVVTKNQAREIISIMRLETHVLDVALVFILSVFLKNIGKFL